MNKTITISVIHVFVIDDNVIFIGDIISQIVITNESQESIHHC
jgi:hypothetical protein